MSNKASKEEVVEGKLKTAFNLIKKERYGAARQILRGFPDNPKAQAMLQMMEGKVEKRRGFSAISKRTLLMVAAVALVCCTVTGISLLFVNYFSRYNLEELFVLALAVVGDEDAAQIAVAINYCKIMQDFRPNTCEQWPLEIVIQYPHVAEACFTPHAGSFFLEDEQIRAILQCLRNYPVSRTY